MKQLMLEEKKKKTQQEVQWMRGTRGVWVKDLTAALTFSKGEHRKEGEESGKKQTRKMALAVIGTD